MRKVLVASNSRLAWGCSPSLTPAGSAEKLKRADPPAVAQRLETSARRPLVGAMQPARTRMRNEAGEKGANYVRYETFSLETGSTGTAYKCPKRASTAAPTASPPTPTASTSAQPPSQ